MINTARFPGDCDQDYLGYKLKLKTAPGFSIHHDENTGQSQTAKSSLMNDVPWFLFSGRIIIKPD